jgi:hypothetical protein
VSIELHIERLVIDEAVLGGERADAVRAAIERELVRRLRLPGTADNLHHLGPVAALPSAALPAATLSPEPLGVRIASAVHQGLGFDTTVHDRGASRHD